jgi:adenosylhomocysteine nucleosidase
LPRVAIIAALDRELRPLVRNWRAVQSQHEDHWFTFFESSYAVAVCAGIGPECGRRAAEAVIARYSPELIVSAGLAGALSADLRVGETVFPAIVIDARDSSRHETAIKDTKIAATPLAKTILVSYPEIADFEQKQKLGKAYGAHAVDMEAASVAVSAEARRIPFIAIKSISDDLTLDLPAMTPFIQNGQFQTTRFALHAAVRPWLWLKVIRLAQNSRIASENLCAWLRESALTNTIVTALRAGPKTGAT